MSLAIAGWAAALLAGGGWMRCGVRGRIRTELVARACHEVRGPLTAASLALHAATRPRPGAPSSTAGAEREIARAARALDDVVAAGHGAPVADRNEPVDVRELLAAQAATWRPVARSLGSELRIEGATRETVVRGDRRRLVHATSNLIANALEHGGGRVTLGTHTRGDHVRIEVADDGRGVPPVLFGRRATRRRGRGRGLIIVADIAARHGGRLLALTSPRGTRMTLELPRREPGA